MYKVARVLAAVLLLAACRASADDADARLTEELDRLTALQTKLEGGDVPELVKELLQPNRQSLDRVKQAATPELKLYRLRDAFIGIETVAFVTEQKAAGASADAFLALWNARPPQPVAIPGGTPLLHAALMEAAVNRSQRLQRASLPYGKASGPFSGVYYLGEAHATAAFGRFVATLGARVNEAPPSAKSLTQAIDGLEADMLRVFEKDPAANVMIGSSVRLKEARELLERNYLSGATLLLLEARLSFGRNTAPDVAADVKPPAGLPNDSMAALWRSSDQPVAIRDVLPFYVSLRRAS